MFGVGRTKRSAHEFQFINEHIFVDLNSIVKHLSTCVMAAAKFTSSALKYPSLTSTCGTTHTLCISGVQTGTVEFSQPAHNVTAAKIRRCAASCRRPVPTSCAQACLSNRTILNSVGARSPPCTSGSSARDPMAAATSCSVY